MTTLLETLTKGTAYLEKKGVDSPRLTMELLLAHALKMKRMQLYLEFEKPLTEQELTILRELLKKRGEKIPLQHIIGSVDFHGREFLCDARALIPRPETEELIAFILKLDLPNPLSILDLCSGSGIIGLTLKAELGAEATITLADLSSDALSLSRENAEKLGLEAQFIESDCFDNITESYDLIVCNPPYVADGFEISAEVQHDPALALFSGKDGLDLIRKIIPKSTKHLNPEGWLALEIGHDQSNQLETLLNPEFKNITVYSDMENIPRFPVAQKA